MATLITHTTKNEVTSKNSPISADQEPTSCGTNTCSSGVCSPCLVIWGLAGLYFLVTILVEYFQ